MMQPYSDVIMVRPVQEPDEAESIIQVVDGQRTTVPRVAETTRRWGEVIATGPGRWNKKRTVRLPMGVKPGDTVFFGYHTGMGVRVNKTDVHETLVMRESDVLFVLDSEAA